MVASASFKKTDSIIENYDYSKVKEIQGIIIDIEECDSQTTTGGAGYTYWRETVELTNGTIVKIDTTVGNGKIGDTVIVYNEGSQYTYSTESVALDNSNAFLGFQYISIPV